jgi:hypothetical protein
VSQDTIGGLSQRVREAWGDALEAQPFEIHDVLNSEAQGLSARVVPLPSRVSRVIRVNARVGTGGGDGLELKHWKLDPQTQTPNLLLEDVCTVTTPLNIHYVHVPHRIPLTDPRLAASITSGATTVYTTGVPDPTTLVVPGYLELTTPFANTATREVVRYNAVSNTGFGALVRGIEGIQTTWTQGSCLSYVVEMPPGILPVLSRRAQANLFEYLLQDRSMYPMYAAIVGEAASPAEELAALIGLLRSLSNQDSRRAKSRPETVHRVSRRRRM